MSSSTASIVPPPSGTLQEKSTSAFLHYLSTVIPSLLWLPTKIDIIRAITSLESNEEAINQFIQSSSTETLHVSILTSAPAENTPSSSSSQPTEYVTSTSSPTATVHNGTLQIYLSVRSGTSSTTGTNSYPSNLILLKMGNKVVDLDQPLPLQLQPVLVNQPYEYSISSSSRSSSTDVTQTLSLSPAKAPNTSSWSTLSTLENVLRLAYGPTLNQVLQAYQRSSTFLPSSSSLNYLLEAEKYLHELSSTLHRCQQTVLATITLPEFLVEPEIQSAVQQCLREGKDLSPRETSIFSASSSSSSSADVSYPPELISRLEGSLLKWLIVIKNFQNEISTKETTDINEMNDIAIFLTPKNDTGRENTNIDTFNQESTTKHFGGRYNDHTIPSSSSLSPLATAFSIHNEVSWWNSVDKGITVIQNHLQSHATRLTLTILKEAKKRFAVSAFESEANIRSLIERTNTVLPFIRSLPIQNLTNSDTIASLTKTITHIMEYMRRTLQTMHSNQQIIDFFRVQRFLWSITYEIGAVSTRILQNMCIQEHQNLLSSTVNKSRANYSSSASSVSILTLPLESTFRIIEQWESIEAVWRTASTDCYRTYEEIEKNERNNLVTTTNKTKRTKDNAPLPPSITTTRIPYNPLLDNLTERIRVAGEFRRNHATFVELLDGLLVSKAIGKSTLPGSENASSGSSNSSNSTTFSSSTAHRLMDEMKLIQQQLDSAWNRAVQTAGNPLMIDDPTPDSIDSFGSTNDGRERWVIAVRTYSNEVERLEQQVGKAIENAIRGVLGEHSTRLLSGTAYTIETAKSLSLSTWSELVLLFQQLQSWSTISRIQEILRPYQTIFIDLTVLLLQEIILDAERGPPKEETSNDETGLPPLVQRLQWLLSLRSRCDTAMLRIPSLLCLDPRTVTIDPRCWRQSELVVTLVPIVDKVLQLTDAYSEANGWLIRTESLLNIVEGRMAEEEAQKLNHVTANDIALAKRQLVMKQTPLRIQTVRARDYAHARSLSNGITMNNQYPSFIIELPAPGITENASLPHDPSKAVTANEKTETINDTAVTLKTFGIFTVAFGSLLESIMREIRALTDSQITKQLVLRIPQSLRILSASASTVYPQAVIAGKALGTASHTQEIMEDIANNFVPVLNLLRSSSSSSMEAINRSSTFDNAYALVDTLLAKEREQFELAISKVCGKTAVIHWLSDDLEKYTKEISRTVAVFETTARTLQTRIRTLKEYVLNLTTVPYESVALSTGLSKLMQPLQELVENGIGTEGLVKLRSIVYNISANILRTLLAATLTNDIQQKYPSQTVRVIMRAGQVQTEPSFDEVRKRMYNHLQTRIDTVTNLIVPSLVLGGTVVPETRYGSSVILFEGETLVNPLIQSLMNQYTSMVDESILSGQQNIQLWAPYERFWYITPATLAQHIHDHHTRSSNHPDPALATENILNLWYNELRQLLNDKHAATKAEIIGNTPTKYGCVSMESGDIAATCANRLDAWVGDLLVRYMDTLSTELQSFQTLLTTNHHELLNILRTWDTSLSSFTATSMVVSLPIITKLLQHMYGSLDNAQYALFTLPTLTNPSSTEQERLYTHGWKKLVRLFAQHEELLLHARREPLPSSWITATNLGETYDNFTRTLTKGMKVLASNVSNPVVPTAIITQEDNVIAQILTLSRRWMIEKPVTVTGMAVQPSHSLHSCRTFMNEVQIMATELRKLWSGIDSLNELCTKFNMGDPFTNLRLGTSTTTYSIATVRSNGTTALGNLETSIKEIIQLWEELQRIWEPLVQLRMTNWYQVQPRTLRTTLEEATTKLAAMDTNLQTYEAYNVIVTLVKRWRSYVPIVSDLRSPSICDRHLLGIGTLLGLPPSIVTENSSGSTQQPVWISITLGNILDTNIIATEKQLRAIVRQSQGETGIAEFLQEMGKGWESMVWDTVPYRTSHARVVRGWDTHLATIDDHLSSLSSMKMSPFFSPFATEASLWENRLTLLRQCLDAWIDMQRTWLYLDGLLQANPDIRTQLPLEAQRFGHVDAEYVALTSMLTAAPQVLACPCLSLGQVVPMAVRGGASAVSLLSVAPGNIYQRLQAMSETLNRVQAGLSEFLDRKRSLFARFFFLGDEDLLELLGASRDPQAAVRHLRSMFAGITGLTVRHGVEDMEGDKIIDGVTSQEGERIYFTTENKIIIRRDGSVPLHTWLENVSRNTAVTLAQGSMYTYHNLRKAYSTGGGTGGGIGTAATNSEAMNVAKALVDLLTTLPCEAVLLGLWCFWTSSVEYAILTGASANATVNNRTSIGGNATTSNPRTSIGGTNPGAANVTTNIIRIAAVLEASLQAVSSTLAHSLSDKVSSNGSQIRLVRQKLEQSVIDLVHKRDVTRALVNNRIQQISDFEWRSRLRAYLTPVTGNSSASPSSLLPCTVSISMADARMDHGLEYHGIGERLVQTPLTDRAYLALMHALHLRLGGCPFGPAGTGKTETVKALGSTLGRFVLVFNTDESFDFRAMGRIFSGLCQVGAWGAFDEFNRLEERVLSAISQQILAIQTSLASNSAGVELLGKRITLHKDVAIFVTMNPGYAGRSQLPDNLKALFRPIAMVAPDVRLIAAVTLFTQGFATADDLATRVTSLFQACATNLSKQGHYDYGLRALKTVLLQAGHMKRLKIADTAITVPPNPGKMDSIQESVIVATSIVESVLPKLLPDDIAPFRTILASTFPDATTTSAGTILFAHAAALIAYRHRYVWKNDGSLHAPSSTTLDSTVGSNVLASANDWLGKVVQLYEMQNARHGLMILGPPGCGKTSAWRTVLEAMTMVDGLRYETHVIDAKALISRTNNSPNSAKEQFYGRLEPTTLEWSDGVFTATLRTILNNARGELSRRQWIILDGEVDPDWAESLNSVLDDTKQLTLPSGERLSIPSNVRLVFEVDALRYATLATVSRCGMVCFSNETVNPVILCRQFIYQLLQGNVPTLDTNGTGLPVGGKSTSVANVAAEGETTSSTEPPLRQRLLMNIGAVLETDLCHPSAYVQTALQMAIKGSTQTNENGSNSSTVTSPVMANSSNALVKFMLQLLLNGIQQLVQYVTENDSPQDPYASSTSNVSFQDVQTYIQRVRQYTVMVCCWAYGSSYNPSFRRQLSDSIYAIATSLPSVNPSTSSNGTVSALSNYVPVPLPRLGPGSSIYDYTLNLRTGDWSTWTNSLPVSQLEPSDVLDSSLIISTTDTLRHTMMLENWLTTCAPVVLCGPPGSGKTMLLNAVLNGNKWVNNSHVAWLSFSSATSPEYILRTLEQYCEYTRQGDGWILQPVPVNTLGSNDDTSSTSPNRTTSDARLVVFCDEINLPAADKYGTQKVIAYLRQLILSGGFWAPMTLNGGNSGNNGGSGNRTTSNTVHSSHGPTGTDPVWISLKNVQFVAACNPPTDAGRVALPSRLLRHTPIIYVGYPSYQGLQGIYTTFTNALCRLHPSLEILAEPLALGCLDIYAANANKFTTAMAPQYIYSPRELSRWMRALYEGLLPLANAAFPGTENDNRLMLIRLWLHEGLRLFQDRLIDENDRQWCSDTFDTVAQQRFSTISKGSITCTLELSTALRRPVFFSDWTTGAYMSVSLNDLQAYVQIRAKEFSDESMKIMTETTNTSNNSSAYDGGLIVYEDALAHMLRIDRVLMQPLGHLLLAGASGAGKTLLTRFIAWMRGMSIFSVRVSHKYTITDFDRDLRTVMMRAGASCEPIAFIFDEGNVLSTAFLERMNALLASGEVPGLFEGDDRIILLNACRDGWNNTGTTNKASSTAKGTMAIDLDNDEAVLRQFTRNVQRYLHVVFTMNPATSAFSNRRTTSPALFNRCVVDWFGDWSPQARIQIAYAIAGNLALDSYGNKGGTAYSPPKTLSQSTSKNSDILRNLLGFATSARVTSATSVTTSIAKSVKGTPKGSGAVAASTAVVNGTTYTDAIVALFSSIHMSVMETVEDLTRTNNAMKSTTPVPVPFVSPRDYMDMLHQFLNLYHEKRVSIEERQTHLHAGLDRLRATEEAVTSLRASLAIKQADLATKNEAANAKLAQMMADQVEAEKKRTASLQLRAKLAKTTEEVTKRETEVSNELSEAEPALLDAQTSVQGINRQHLDELRSLASPPQPVRLCMEAVLTLLGNGSGNDNTNDSTAPSTNLTWTEIRKVLKGTDFIPNVVNLRTESLSTRVRKVVNDRYIVGAAKDFNFERINGASKACGPLYKWVVSQLQYAAILERVAPLRAEANHLAIQRESLATEAEELDRTLKQLEASIVKYKGEYATLIGAAEGLRSEMNSVASKVDRAVALLQSLARERTRWESSSKMFAKATRSLATDCVLSAAFLAYGGWYDMRTRTKLETQWCTLADTYGVPSGNSWLTVTGNNDGISNPSNDSTAIQPSPALEFLCTSMDRVKWQSFGIQTDELGIGNAVLLNRFRRFPLIIDPSQAAISFLTRLIEKIPNYRQSLGKPNGNTTTGNSLGTNNGSSASRTLVKASFLDNGYLKAIEAACRFGTPLLLTDAEFIDPVLNPVLNREYTRSNGGGGRILVRIGETEVDLSPSFTLYLFTRNPTTQFTPDIVSRVTMVNFSITASSLQDTLLNETLTMYAPAVQEQRTILLASRADADARLQALEERLLDELSGNTGTVIEDTNSTNAPSSVGPIAQGSILEDRRVLLSLEALKAEAATIEATRDRAASVLLEVGKVSTAYAPVALAACSAYFALQHTSQAICSLYQFSLHHFLLAFKDGLRKGARYTESNPSINSTGTTTPSTPVPEPLTIAKLVQAVLIGIDQMVNRSMYTHHGRSWSLAILRILAQSWLSIPDNVSMTTANPATTGKGFDVSLVPELYDYHTLANDKGVQGKPTSNVLPFITTLPLEENDKKLLHYLVTLPSCTWSNSLMRTFSTEPTVWLNLVKNESSLSVVSQTLPSSWVRTAEPVSKSIPDLDELLQNLRTILLASILRKDLVPSCIDNYAQQYLQRSMTTVSMNNGSNETKETNGSTGSESTGYRLISAIEQADATHPIVLFCTPGADADTAVTYASTFGTLKPASSLRTVSMGAADSEQNAAQMITLAARDGGWVLLRNIHLASVWVTSMMQKLKNYSPTEGTGTSSASGGLGSKSVSPGTNGLNGNNSNTVVVSNMPTLPYTTNLSFRLIMTIEIPQLLLTSSTSSSSSSSAGKETFSTGSFHLPTIPSIILQESVKCMLETPIGLRSTLLRALSLIDPLRFTLPFDNMNLTVPSTVTASLTTLIQTLRGRLYFLTAWFHSVVLERRRYVPQGWKKVYDFSDADWIHSLTTIDNILRTVTLNIQNTLINSTNTSSTATTDPGIASGSIPPVPPPTFSYTSIANSSIKEVGRMMMETIHGGRIEFDDDVQILRTLITHILSPSAMQEGYVLNLPMESNTSTPTGSSLPSSSAVSNPSSSSSTLVIRTPSRDQTMTLPSMLQFIHQTFPSSTNSNGGNNGNNNIVSPTILGLANDADKKLLQVTGNYILYLVSQLTAK